MSKQLEAGEFAVLPSTIVVRKDMRTCFRANGFGTISPETRSAPAARQRQAVAQAAIEP
jgi:hypothetical protein